MKYILQRGMQKENPTDCRVNRNKSVREVQKEVGIIKSDSLQKA